MFISHIFILLHVAGHWNYSLEALRGPLAQAFGAGTVLDAWAQCGQWGLRCAAAGATEVVLLEDSLGLAKLCRENATLNGPWAEFDGDVWRRPVAKICVEKTIPQKHDLMTRNSWIFWLTDHSQWGMTWFYSHKVVKVLSRYRK